MGYWRAGFAVFGNSRQLSPNFPWPGQFAADDVLHWLDTADLDEFDLIAISPPCQRWSAQPACRAGLAEQYPDLIAPARERLLKWAGPFIIENVEGARGELRDPVMLCGTMFGLELRDDAGQLITCLYRHRYFETGGGFKLEQPEHPAHPLPASKGCGPAR
jgi:DNA (cytosine-5)-methyltransferase 1